MTFEGLTEGIIVLQWYYRLRKVVEIATQNVRGIMYSVTAPIQALPIARWGVERRLELFDSLF
jgi:hypothetical protein